MGPSLNLAMRVRKCYSAKMESMKSQDMDEISYLQKKYAETFNPLKHRKKIRPLSYLSLCLKP